MKKRLEYIDISKGILIILMVIGHIWQGGFVFNLIYAFHMPAFFVISGMLMQHTKSYRKPYMSFVKSRIFSYGIPFIFIEFLGCLTDILRNGITLNIKGYLYNTLTFNFNDGNLWFLVALCLIELLFAALTRAIKSGPIMACLSVVLFAVRYLLPKEVLYIGTLSTVFKYYLFFVVGFYWNGLLQKKHKLTTITCIAVVLLYVLSGSLITACGKIVHDVAYMISGLCGTYVILQFAQNQFSPSIRKGLAFAGRNTLIIYGTHHIYYAAIGVLLGIQDFSTTPVLTGCLILILVVLLEIPTICIINRWLPILAGKRGRKPQTV